MEQHSLSSDKVLSDESPLNHLNFISSGQSLSNAENICDSYFLCIKNLLSQKRKIDQFGIQHVIQHCENSCDDCSSFHSVMCMADVIAAYDFYKHINCSNALLPENLNSIDEVHKNFSESGTGNQNVSTCRENKHFSSLKTELFDQAKILRTNLYVNDKNLQQNINSVSNHLITNNENGLFIHYNNAEQKMESSVPNVTNLKLYKDEELNYEAFSDESNESVIQNENANSHENFLNRNPFQIVTMVNKRDEHKIEVSNQDSFNNYNISIEKPNSIKNSGHSKSVINNSDSMIDKLSDPVSIDAAKQKQNVLQHTGEIMFNPLQITSKLTSSSETFCTSIKSHDRLLALKLNKKKLNVIKLMKEKSDCSTIQRFPNSGKNPKFLNNFRIAASNLMPIENNLNLESDCLNSLSKSNIVSSSVKKVFSKPASLYSEDNVEKALSQSAHSLLKSDFQDESTLFLRNEALNRDLVNSYSVNLRSKSFIENCSTSLSSYNSSSDSCNEDSDSESEKSFKRRRKNFSLENTLCNGLLKESKQVKEVGVIPNNTLLTRKPSKFKEGVMENSSTDSASFDFSKKSNMNSQTLDASTQSIKDQGLTSLTEIVPKGSLKEILASIKIMCFRGELQKAIFISKSYMLVSIPEVRNKIFISLFLEIMNAFRNSNQDINEEIYDKTFEVLLKILKENSLYNSETCSIIISECLLCKGGSKFACEILKKCVNSQIPIFDKAASVCSKFLDTAGGISNFLIFVHYLEDVCKLMLPKELLHKLLSLCACKFKIISSLEFKDICCLLCNHNFDELDSNYVEDFFKVCMEEELWKQISTIFQACAEKGNFGMIRNLHQALSFPLEETGDNFEKFAAAVFDTSKSSPDLMALCGQIGICLLLETFDKKEMNSALKILFVFHERNINYYELLPSIHIINHKSITFSHDPFDVLISKEKIFFTSMEILLYFKRPIDAFNLFKNFDGILLSGKEHSELKLKILKQRYLILLELANVLIAADPYHEGFKALHMILSVEENGLNFDLLEDHIKDISRTYNQYLAKLLNGGNLEAALELFEHKYGLFKDKLPINPLVRRGFVVSCMNNGMVEKAKKLFCVGYIKKSYSIQQPDENCWPHSLIISTSWTTEEIKLILEQFFEMLHPVLLSKDKTKMKWFTLRIKYRVQNTQKCGLKCLSSIACDMNSSMERTKKALLRIDCNLVCNEKEFIENKSVKKGLEIPAKLFYMYWKNKLCSSRSATINDKFIVSNKSYIFFGTNEPERRNEDFGKISKFLKAKILLKYKDMSPDSHQKKAEDLAVIFIRNNLSLNKLDKKGMKLLNVFSNENV